MSGQDADLAGVRRVAAGTQTMTIYKPLKSIASTAAQVAVELVQGKQPAFNAKLDNGKGQVDSILLAHAADARQPGHLGQRRVLYGGTDRGQVAATGDG